MQLHLFSSVDNDDIYHNEDDMLKCYQKLQAVFLVVENSRDCLDLFSVDHFIVNILMWKSDFSSSDTALFEIKSWLCLCLATVC